MARVNDSRGGAWRWGTVASEATCVLLFTLVPRGFGQHFVAGQHPGAFAPRLEADRDGLYFYWTASVAQTLRLAGVGRRLEPAGQPPVTWAEDLARDFLDRQREDGAWSNPIVTMREDEPLVASSMALLALASLRPEIP